MIKKTLALILFVSIASCSDENSKIRGQFIAGCMQPGVPKSVCSCAFKKLESKYTTEELNKISKTVPTDKFLKDMMESFLVCQND